MNRIKLGLIVLICNFFTTYMNAQKLQLPALFGNGMVLQQKSKVSLWGWGEPGQPVTVKSDWGAKTKAMVNEDGKWMCKLKTIGYGTSHTLEIESGNEKQVINDVALGEVWLCSGQSNMGFTLSQHIKSDSILNLINNPDIHLFKVPYDTAHVPQNAIGQINWETANPISAATFSAVAYFFGEKLQRELDVPVGLILSQKGGSTAEAWVNESVLKSNQELAYLISNPPDDLPYKDACYLYNAMIHPLIPYTIKGTIWYQGEANKTRAEEYKTLFPALIESWREEFKNENMPFYYAQIAPFDHNYSKNGNTNAAQLRDAQLYVMNHIPNTGMVVTTDVGNIKDVHPKDKRKVGERLSRYALAKDYHKKVDFSGPIYNSYKIKGSEVTISFKYAKEGLLCKGDKLTWFTISDENGKFYNAEAKVEGSKVVVSSPEVKKPVEVRFGWSNIAEPNLFDKNGLPASPFRFEIKRRK